jgi:hypothetical protein
MGVAESRGLRALLRLSFAALLASAAAGAQDQRPNPTGKFYVADASGGVRVSNGSKIDQLARKSVYKAEGTTIETESDASASLVLSNSTGIHLDAATRMQIILFQQNAFRPNRTDLEEEPSASQTRLLVEYGTIGLSTGKLTAESTLEIDTPDASIFIHGCQVLIKVVDGSTQISMIEGAATIRTGPTGAPTFVKSGQGIQIREGRSGQPVSVVVQDISTGAAGGLPQVSDPDVEGAQAAQKLVYFNVQNTSGAGIEVFDGAAAQGGGTALGSAANIVAIPVVPAVPPVEPTVSAANLTSAPGG